MKARLRMFIDAPIDDVFAFFDNPTKTIQFQDRALKHFVASEVIEVRPDGRCLVDVQMRAGKHSWVQTIDQELREAPTRLATRSWTWTKDRTERISTLTTDRRFAAEGGGTWMELSVGFHLEHPWRHPLAVVVNRIWGDGAARVEIEHAQHAIAAHIEAGRQAASLD